MEKIEVGEYVRTKDGIIDKVITEDEKNNSIATISYNKSVAIDTVADYTYYFYKYN